MIRRVNFFGKQREETPGISYRKMAILSAVLLGLLLLLVANQKIRLKMAQKELALVEGEIGWMKTSQGIGEKDAKTSLSPVETVIISMVSEPAWPEMLRVIPKSLSDGIWLEKIHGEIGPEGGKTVLEGTAYQARLVPGFLDRLRSFNAFSKLNLISSEAATKEAEAPLKFKLQAKNRER